MYEFKGKELGNLILEIVISVSKKNQFSKLNLNIALFMSSLSLYKNFGFKETCSYPESISLKELWDKLIFMMKDL